MQLFQKTVGCTSYISKTWRLFGRNKSKISVSQRYKKGEINIYSLLNTVRSQSFKDTFKKREPVALRTGWKPSTTISILYMKILAAALSLPFPCKIETVLVARLTWNRKRDLWLDHNSWYYNQVNFCNDGYIVTIKIVLKYTTLKRYFYSSYHTYDK